MDFTDKFIRYHPDITFEIFQLIWDKLHSLGWKNSVDFNINKIYDYFSTNRIYLERSGIPQQFNVYDTELHNTLFKEITVEEFLGYNPFNKSTPITTPTYDYKTTITRAVKANDPNIILVEGNISKEDFISNLKDNGCKLNASKHPVNLGCWRLGCNSDNCPFSEKFSFQHLLDWINQTPKESISVKENYPEYYEFIGTNGSFTTGKIYKIKNPKNLEEKMNFIDDRGGNNGFSGTNYKYFKPSTKEAFDLQEQPIPIESLKQSVHCKTQEEWDFKIGDWIITKDYCEQYDGKPLHLAKIDTQGYCYFDNTDDKRDNCHLEMINRLATSEEIQSVQSKPIQPITFVLPEKWCIKITKENLEFCKQLRKYELGFSYNYDYSIGAYYSSIRTNSGFLGSENLGGRIEITFDQFKQYVLKDVSKKEEIMENKIEKWSPGTYVLMLKDNVQENGFKKFTIKEIREFNKDVVNYIGGKANTIDKENSGDIKWFATLKEAEVYRDSLQKIDPMQSILEEAIRKYPIGTKFIPAHINEGLNQVIGNWEIIAEDINCKSDVIAGHWNGCLYHGGKWAEIITEPNKSIMKTNQFNCPFSEGELVSCEIEGRFISSAKIHYEDNRIYICQNEENGFESENKLGYKYSWVICGIDVNDDSWDEGLDQHSTKNVKSINQSKPKEYNLYTTITRAVASNDPNILFEESGLSKSYIIDRLNHRSCTIENITDDNEISCAGLDCNDCPFYNGRDAAIDWLNGKSTKCSDLDKEEDEIFNKSGSGIVNQIKRIPYKDLLKKPMLPIDCWKYHIGVDPYELTPKKESKDIPTIKRIKVDKI